MAPKFTYFPTRGAGEVIRMLFKYGELEFEDERIEVSKWPELKPSTPFGHLPMLEEDGKVVSQSVAIARYVAKKVKLVGSDDWENLEIDAVVATIVDLLMKFQVYAHEKEPERKQIIKDQLVAETVPFYLGRLDRIAEENGGHLAVGKLTWADIYFTSLDGVFSYIMGPGIVEKYPNLSRVVSNVLELPTIKAWVESRPKSDM